MSPLFEKLNWKDFPSLLVLDAPAFFEPELSALQAEGVSIQRDPSSVDTTPFALAFVTTLQEVEAATKAIAPLAQGDALVWLAYPKGTSRRYRCEFNRDTGWAALGEARFEAVRQVEHIKTMTRASSRGGGEPGRKETILGRG